MSPNSAPAGREGPLAYTIQTFCQQVSLSRSSAYKLIRSGQLKSILLAGRRLVPASEAARLIENPHVDAAPLHPNGGRVRSRRDLHFTTERNHRASAD